MLDFLPELNRYKLIDCRDWKRVGSSTLRMEGQSQGNCYTVEITNHNNGLGSLFFDDVVIDTGKAIANLFEHIINRLQSEAKEEARAAFCATMIHEGFCEQDVLTFEEKKPLRTPPSKRHSPKRG